MRMSVQRRHSVPSIEPALTSGYEENNGPLPHIEELLGGAGEAQALQDTAANVKHESGSADGFV